MDPISSIIGYPPAPPADCDSINSLGPAGRLLDLSLTVEASAFSVQQYHVGPTQTDSLKEPLHSSGSGKH